MLEYQFLQVIHDLCRTYNLSISSTHRTPKHNKAVGGVVNSQHLGFRAVDLVFDDSSMMPTVDRLCRNLGFWTLDEGDHLHVDDRYNTQLKKGLTEDAI